MHHDRDDLNRVSSSDGSLMNTELLVKLQSVESRCAIGTVMACCRVVLSKHISASRLRTDLNQRGEEEENMSTRPNLDTNAILHPTSRVAFAVAACAFMAAGIGAILNYWVAGWMAVGGMTGIGLFYIVIRLINVRTTCSYDNENSISTKSQRTARASNLYGESVTSLTMVDTRLTDFTGRMQTVTVDRPQNAAEVPKESRNGGRPL